MVDSFVIDLILMLVFLAVGFFALTRSGINTFPSILALIVAIIFLVVGVWFGLMLAGISV